MIRIENVNVFGWEAAIRGMRNPMNSWGKSDSHYNQLGYYQIGNNDLTLMKKLKKAGTEHAKYLRMINLTVDLTAPLYWWKEFDTYKVGTVSNSCSTMHKIHSKEFTLDDFSCEYLVNEGDFKFLKDFEYTIKALNSARDLYLDTKDKKYWWQMVQLLPSSYNQKRTIQLNYAVLSQIYHQRKNHKLDEWVDLCYWIETLPYSELITGKFDEV